MHTNVRTYVYTYVHTYIHTYIHTPTNALSYKSVPLTNLQSLQITLPLDFIRDQDSPLMHKYIHTYLHTHTHTHTHTYIHNSFMHPSIQPLTHLHTLALRTIHPFIPRNIYIHRSIHPSIGPSKHLIQWEILMRKSFVKDGPQVLQITLPVDQGFSNCGPRTTRGPRVLPLWSF